MSPELSIPDIRGARVRIKGHACQKHPQQALALGLGKGRRRAEPLHPPQKPGSAATTEATATSVPSLCPLFPGRVKIRRELRSQSDKCHQPKAMPRGLGEQLCEHRKFRKGNSQTSWFRSLLQKNPTKHKKDTERGGPCYKVFISSLHPMKKTFVHSSVTPSPSKYLPRVSTGF